MLFLTKRSRITWIQVHSKCFNSNFHLVSCSYAWREGVTRECNKCISFLGFIPNLKTLFCKRNKRTYFQCDYRVIMTPKKFKKKTLGYRASCLTRVSCVIFLTFLASCHYNSIIARNTPFYFLIQLSFNIYLRYFLSFLV